MDSAGLVLEGVKNSKEAGASFVDINIEFLDGYIAVTISDDGNGNIPEDPFDAGVSTKGKGRGLGLSNIKCIDKDATLTREGEITMLSFKAKRDSSFDELRDVLFPIVNMDGRVSFKINKSGKNIFTYQSYGSMNTLSAIRDFKREVKEKEKKMSKLTLDELNSLRQKEVEKLKKRDIHGKSIHVVVAMGTSGIEKGAKVVLNTIADEVEKAGLDDVIITQYGSAAPNPEPVVEVYSKERGLTVYGNVSKDDAVRIVKEHIIGGNVLSDKEIKVEEV